MDIRYVVKARSKGRNGFFSTSGVSLEKWTLLGEELIEVTLFTGRGVISNAITLNIPKDKAAEIGRALIDLSKEK
jgi:hypothetical protein